MAQVKVVTDSDIGLGLKIEGAKLVAAVDNKTIKVVDGVLTATEQVELHVTAIAANKDTGTFTVTVADSEGGNATTLEASLADLVAISKEEGNLAVAKDDGIFVGKAEVKVAVKEDATVEFQSLAGTTLGYAFETVA